MTDKKKNILVSGLFLVFGAFVFFESLGIKHMMKNDVGSAFFPRVISIAIMAVAAIRLVLALREKEGQAKASKADMKGGWETILLVGAYVLAFNSVGFLISTAIYLFLQMLVLTPADKRSIPLLGAVSLITPVFIYVLFVYIIHTPLPKGIFGF